MFKNRKNKLITVVAMIILSMSARQTKGMIMAPSSIALPFVKLVSWGAGKVKGSIMPSMIHEAISVSGVMPLKLLLKIGATKYINEVDNKGETPLFRACSCLRNAEEIVKLLLDNGAIESINMQNNDGITPLAHSCCYYCPRLKLIELLLNNGAIEGINMQSNTGVTALSIACSNTYDDNALELVKLLLNNGAIESINKQAHDGRTPLMRACEGERGVGQIGVVKLLLENGAIESINEQDNDGRTVLYRDVFYFGNIDIERLLLENGANIQGNVVTLSLRSDSVDLALRLQRSNDKVLFIKNSRLERQEDFEFLVKVLRGDLLVQLSKPEARGNTLSIISKSGFYEILMDQRFTKEEKGWIERIIGCKFEGILDVHDYMLRYSEKRLPKVYKAMQRFKFFKECAKVRYSDCEVVCDSVEKRLEDDSEVVNEGQMIGGLTESEFEGIRTEADRIARQMVQFEASMSRSFALDEDQAGRIYKEQFEKAVRQLTEKRLEELAKNKNK